MERHAFALSVKKGRMADFRSNLGKVWEEFTVFLDEHKMNNFSLWNVENVVFGYYETENVLTFEAKAREQVEKWEKEYADAYEWISTPFEEMRLMYHDFGIVRVSKELIRHRVFITKLVPGTEEEYKARHDALVKARGDKITLGPDSNFSIWNAGGYIFGYDEIDTTMEHECTTEEKESSIQWETKMLEIMSWLTNDVDWITGECHESVKRIAWHSK